MGQSLNMTRVTQTLDNSSISNLEKEVRRELDRIELGNRLPRGGCVAITAGSRGIASIQAILSAVVRYVRESGANPFLLAAMGSHGGGTAQGQRSILAELGLTEECVGAPVVCNPCSERVGFTDDGLAVFTNIEALKADAVIVVNRVKPHTSFRNFVESGLTKMIAVGLGGPAGAAIAHSSGPASLRDSIPKISRRVMERVRIVGGLAIVENSAHAVHTLKAVMPDEMECVETLLLAQARQLMPKIPFERLDVLIIDEMGKNYSGTGIDTNVIGRLGVRGQEDCGNPKIQRIIVLDLSKESKGNATGVGLADFITRRLYEKIDLEATYKNVLTSKSLMRGMIPIVMSTDQRALESAICSLRSTRHEALRIARIKNTLDLDQIMVSKVLVEECRDIAGLRVACKEEKVGWDVNGSALSW